MLGYLMDFKAMPSIGFALHCKIPHYKYEYTPDSETIEIIYIKSGTIIAEFEDWTCTVPPGSILIIQRNLPFYLYTKNNETNEHSTIQVISDFNIKLTKNLEADYQHDKNALVLPVFIAPCTENEKIFKKMNSIISDAGALPESSKMSRSVALVSLFHDISQIFKSQKLTSEKTPSILCYKVKKLIQSNYNENITLETLASQIGKTPNYLNHIFKEETGMNIHQFIIKEKIRIICDLILSRSLSFKDACFTVGISDVAYGYRLFKKQTGLTPGEFLKSGTHRK
ncbi:MAG: helix-turn-helix transcriptional regulator [Clostridia bacterium]|nr:helix-turn-helix transcriptional regulator [Clostridia bacterium]